MEVVSIIDNESSPKNKSLGVEVGYSLFIRTSEVNILVDTGISGSLLFLNCEKLKIDIKSIDVLVLSHHHYDHVGGLWDFLEANEKCKVFVIRPDFERPKYCRLFYVPVSIGFVENSDKGFEKYKERFVYIDSDVFRISESVIVISKFGSNFLKPYVNNILYEYSTKEGTYHLDDFKHEVAIIVRPKESKQVVLVSPCSHNGIVNIILKAESVLLDIFKDERQLVVFGGFHLSTNCKLYCYTEYESRIQKLGEILCSNKRLFEVYTGHCSTLWGYKIMKNTFKNLKYLFCGDRVLIESKSTD